MALLAKVDETLLEHTENALKVFKSLKEAYPEIPKICGITNFWEHLFYAVFLHDFGKGAVGFQNIFKNKSKWDYRHEILSAGFISFLNFENKLFNDATGMAIITHHKDALEIREKYQTYPSPVGKERYEQKLEEIKANIQELVDLFSKISYFSKNYLGTEIVNFTSPDIESLQDVYKNVVLPYCTNMEDDELTPLHGKYGIFLKGFLTACDHLSSGGKYEILDGIQDMRSIYHFPKLRKIQEIALETKGDVFLISPTGSGKTEASLFWSHANQNQKRSKRVFYLLPYTASINAMYNRLQKDFQNSELVGIQHGKAAYFLYKTFSNEEDYVTARDKAKEIKDLTKKIYRPYKILTPFQILKAFFGMKGFEQQLSEMANSLFILDEIHSYDAHTTALLIEILKILKEDYNSNFLIMSATLPSFIKKMFEQELNISNEIALSEEELKEFTRHKVTVLPEGIFDNLDKIRKDIEDNKKVLIVCNTVSQAQKVYKVLSKEVEKSKLIHGRFILRDREEIEKSLKNLDLLVGTQAIEVSLDIDYDVLYSEPAPIDALIQRFGRVNRKGWEKKKICPVYIFEKGSEKDKFVYKNQEIVVKTIDLLRSEDILEENTIQKLVDEVYKEGYQGKDKEEFDTVRRVFPQFFKRIVPFIHENRSEEEFNSLFESVEVVPLQFKFEYTTEIKNKRYFEAMKYIVSISISQYLKLRKENLIEPDEDIKFASVDYDKDLGLLMDEESTLWGIFKS